MEQALDLIKSERERQIVMFGTTDVHDIEQDNGELLKASLYALTREGIYKQDGFERFEEKTDKRSQIDNLVVSAALIAAEIDRLLLIEEYRKI